MDWPAYGGSDAAQRFSPLTQINKDNVGQLERAYQQVTAPDGRPSIATGNTQAKKELLTGAGFRWNTQRKLWWKYVDAA